MTVKDLIDVLTTLDATLTVDVKVALPPERNENGEFSTNTLDWTEEDIASIDVNKNGNIVIFPS